MAGHIQADGDDPVDIMAGYLQLPADGNAQVLQADIDVLRTLRWKSCEAGSDLGARILQGTLCQGGRGTGTLHRSLGNIRFGEYNTT